MEPEIIVGVLAVFVSGGALGAAGTLLSQWVMKKISGPGAQKLSPADRREIALLKAEVADMALQLNSVDERMDFTEQLLGGALSGVRPPEPLPAPDPSDSAGLSEVTEDSLAE